MVECRVPALLTDKSLHRVVLPLLVIEFLWGIGIYFVPATTTLPAYLKALGANTLLIGAMGTTIGALPLLLQLFGRSVIDRFRHRKRGLVIMHVVMIVPYLLISASDWWLAAAHPTAQIVFTIGLLGFSQILMGLIIPVWLDMIAQVIPAPVRGQYFGFTTACSAGGGIVGAVVLIWLQTALQEHVFRGAFLGAGICYLASMAAFALMPIPEEAFTHAPEPSVWARAEKGLRACSPRGDFGRLVGSMVVHTVAMALLPFLVGYASSPQGLGLPKGIFTQVNLYQAIGASLGGAVLGWLVDHSGPRWPWVGMTLMIPVLVFLYPHAGALPVLLVCSLLVGLLTAHWSVSAPALLELSPSGDKSPYIAMANIAGFLPSLIGPLLLGHLIERQGYPAAFLVALVLGLCATGLALTVRGRRNTAPRDA
jgi:MFS family permease